MNKKNLSNCSIEELLVELKSLKENLFHLLMKKSLGNTSSPHMFGVVRKNIARIKTELSKRKKVEQNA